MRDRHIKKHKRYREAVRELAGEFPRAREVFDGAEWALARDPEAGGILLADIGVFRAHLVCPDPIPSHFIFYAFDAREIRFLCIKPVQQS